MQQSLSHDRSARKLYIELLKEASARPDGFMTSTKEQNAGAADLIKEEYLSGTAWCSSTEASPTAMIEGITLKGRLFLGEIQREERDESLWRRAMKESRLLGAFVLGNLTPMAIDVVKGVIHARWGIDFK